MDNCQHVFLGCCTNLLRFYERLGVQNKIRWYDQLTFLEPGGRASIFKPSYLPAPFHTAPAFLRVTCLNMADKLAIAYAMMVLAPKTPCDTGKSFLRWLREHHQTEQAIDRFWKTVLVSALNEDLDRVSVPYAAQVIRESFLKSAAAGRMGIPSVPLTELYGVAGEYIQARRGDVRVRASVESLQPQADAVKLFAGGSEMIFDFVVSAVPFDALSKILPPTSDAEPLRATWQGSKHLQSQEFIFGLTGTITDLDHAVLLDRTIQWMFHKSKLLGKSADNTGSYVELVVSASKRLVKKSRAEIIDLALRELREFFPQARDANLVKSTVIKEVHATYSPLPGADNYRPNPRTVWPRVFLAGDWTATGWPATMEGAVRSGYAAAECLTRVSRPAAPKFVVDDLPPAGLMKLFE